MSRCQQFHRRSSTFAIGLAGLSAAAAAQTALPTRISYQGLMKDNNVPVEGTVTTTFRLYDAATGGNLVGASQPQAIAVVHGVLTATPDFGPNAFNGDARWVELTVDGVVVGSRQSIVATPYALTALKIPGIDGNSLNGANGGPTDAVYVNSQGNVGIGTLTPETKMELRNDQTDARFRVSSHSSSAGIDFAPAGPSFVTMYSPANSSDLRFYTGGADRVTVTGAGIVGIGTTTPNKPLHVQDFNGMQIGSASFGMSSLVARVSAAIDGYAEISSVKRAGLEWGDLVLNPNGGKVGIGTSAPSTPLHVHDVDGLQIGESTPGSSSLLARVSATTAGYSEISSVKSAGSEWGDLVLNPNGGKVGIGGLAPANTLSVAGPADIAGPLIVGATATNAPNNWLAGYFESDQPATEVGIRNAQNNELWSLQASGGTGADPYGATFQIVQTGNIGRMRHFTIYPYSGLVEVRKLRLTGGADIAEPFDVKEDAQLIPGMVVSIDADHAGKLKLATTMYDHAVAGIVSGAGGVDPGVTLQQDDSIANGSHPVALAGRVYCWVDADAAGAVAPGDRLTTSNTPGHAMRVDNPEKAHGAVIGKAMTALDKGKGLVLVLVNLQ